MTSVSVIGAGAWGTALAMAAYRAGRQVTLVAQDEQEAGALSKLGHSPRLPEVSIAKEIAITHDLKACAQSNIILLAVPAQVVRTVTTALSTHLKTETYVVLCSKGIELETGLLMSEIVEETLPGHSVSVLSGPTFAAEIGKGLPAAAAIANQEITTARWLASSLGSHHLRLYPTNDLVGVEICGALKNVIAIACGIATARNLGESARAALITRGLVEISRLGVAMGALEETFSGLSGVGDLVLCCTSSTSRNMALGMALDSQSLEDNLPEGTLTEGAYTAKALMPLREQLEVELPICEAVYRILHEKANIDDEIENLLTRSLKNE